MLFYFSGFEATPGDDQRLLLALYPGITPSELEGPDGMQGINSLEQLLCTRKPWFHCSHYRVHPQTPSNATPEHSLN